jgi:hypothetical protein
MHGHEAQQLVVYFQRLLRGDILKGYFYTNVVGTLTSASVDLSSVPVTDRGSEEVNVSFSDFGARRWLGLRPTSSARPRSPSARVPRSRPDSSPSLKAVRRSY